MTGCHDFWSQYYIRRKTIRSFIVETKSASLIFKKIQEYSLKDNNGAELS